MSRNERIRDKYPLFYAYGGTHTFLEDDAAVQATTEERIRSIWPFIVSRVLAFAESLKPRERVNFDPEDILSDLWVALAEKDDQWTLERGKYITFAGIIIDRELYAIRDKARTVHSPRNSSCRMKKYAEEEENGTISPRRRKTANDIRRTSDSVARIAHGDKVAGDSGESETCVPCKLHDPLSILAGDEDRQVMLDAVKQAVRQKHLTAWEAFVIGRLSGLWGNPPQSAWEIAWLSGRDEQEVRRAKTRAITKIRLHLLSINHPVTESA